VVGVALVLVAAPSLLVNRWATQGGVHGPDFRLQIVPNFIVFIDDVAVFGGFIDGVCLAGLSTARLFGVLVALHDFAAVVLNRVIRLEDDFGEFPRRTLSVPE
jgi:hypothetical protein